MRKRKCALCGQPLGSAERVAHTQCAAYESAQEEWQDNARWEEWMLRLEASK